VPIHSNSIAAKFSVTVTLEPGVPAVLQVESTDGDVHTFECPVEGLMRVAETAIYSSQQAALDSGAPLMRFDLERVAWMTTEAAWCRWCS